MHQLAVKVNLHLASYTPLAALSRTCNHDIEHDITKLLVGEFEIFALELQEKGKTVLSDLSAVGNSSRSNADDNGLLFVCVCVCVFT